MDFRTNQTPSTIQQKGENDTKAYLFKIVSYWRLIVLSLVLCLAAAYVFCRYASPQYLITAKILVEDEKKGGDGVHAGRILGDMSGLLDAKSYVDNEAEILKTRLLAEEVVKLLDLNIGYYREGTVKNVQIYPSPFTAKIIQPADSIKTTSFQVKEIDETKALLSYKDYVSKEEVVQEVVYERPFVVKEIGVLQVRRNLEVQLNSFDQYHFTVTSVEAAVSDLRKQLTVAITNKLASTIDISYKHTIPIKGEAIVGALISEYINKKVRAKNQIADSTIAFIEDRLLIVSKELKDIEQGIQNFKQNNNLADISGQSKILLSNSGDYSKQLSELETQISIISALEDYLKDEKSKGVLPNFTISQDMTFNKLAESYNYLLQDRNRQLLTSTETNPFIKNMDERLLELRKAMLSNLSTSKRTIEISIARLQQNINKANDDIRKVPLQERTYLDLFRQQTLKQELYLFLLKKREETALSKTTNVSNAKIIDPPKSDIKPVSPNKILVMSVGFMAGIVLPLAFLFTSLFAKELLNTRVLSKEEVQKTIPLPLIGEIGHSYSEADFSNTQSVLSEQFRALRAHLFAQINLESKGNCLLITSSMKKEGKTFTALHLGQILALSGKKVLLLDADLRSAGLTEKLGLKGKRGLTHSFSGSSISEIVHPTSIHPTLFVLPTGDLPPNPAETLMQKELDQLIENLKQEFDFILLDTPPIGLVSDAEYLSHHAIITLFVIREGFTYQDQLYIPQQLKLTHPSRKISVVWNDTRKKTKRGAGFGEYKTQKETRGTRKFLRKA